MTFKKIYCFGGDHHVNDPPTVSRMDVSTGKWEKVATMISYRKSFASAQAGSKVYILGGYDRNHRKLRSMEVFDCETHTWIQLGRMPQTRQAIAAAVYNGFLYVIGSDDSDKYGMYNSGIFTEEMVLRYDIQNRKWETMHSLERIGKEHQLVVFNDQLYAIIGCESHYSSVEMYNPKTDSWTRLDLTWDYYDFWFSAAVNDSKIYFTGLSGFSAYCPISKKWTRFEDYPSISGLSLVSIDDKLIATGGCRSRQCITASVYCYQVRRRRRRRRGGKWSELPDMDTPRVGHFSFVVDLYL